MHTHFQYIKCWLEKGFNKEKIDKKSRYVFVNYNSGIWLVGFVALRPKSTAMVIAGRSVHLTTLFPGQA